MSDSGLVPWLLAQIAQQEQSADTIHDMSVDDFNLLEMFGDCKCGWPSRVLAECAAKRKIIEAHAEDYWQLYETRPAVCVICGPEYPCPSLRFLAEPYRSAPGFDPLWLPT